MDSTLKQRLIGAAVLAALAIIFLPMLLKGPDVREPDAAEVPLSMPAAPGQEFETRELPLTVPDAAPPGGVLGLAPGRPATGAAVPVPDADAVSPEPGVEAAPVEAATAATPSPAPAAEAAAAIEAAPTAAAVAAGDYAVNVGSFGNIGNAEALAGKLRAARLPVSSERVRLASGTVMRLRVGPYPDRAAAEAARLRTDAISGASSTVIVLNAPAVAAAVPASRPAPAAPAPTAAPTEAPRVASPAVTGGSGFAVQLSAPASEQEALALRDRARAAGFASFVQRVETDAGARFRVRVGPVADRPSAEAMLDAVDGELGTKGIVVRNP